MKINVNLSNCQIGLQLGRHLKTLNFELTFFLLVEHLVQLILNVAEKIATHQINNLLAMGFHK